MKFKGIEYLEFRTKDSTLYAQYVLNVSDSLQFCADGNKVEFTIPLSKIISIKKYNSFVEGTGYIILGMAMVIAVVYTPIALISDSKKGGRDALEGALGVSAISMPLIVIGSIISKLKLKNWKITRIDGGKTIQ